MEKQLLKIKNTQRTRVNFNFSLHKLKSLEEGYSKTIYLIDENVHRLHAEQFETLEHTIIVAATEENKSLKSIVSLIDTLADLKLDKHGLIVVIGGGILTDLGGFLASIYKRGIDLAFIPTTLLAAVDAAIGGKNGVNHELAKNLIGCTMQPNYLLYDFELFKTLPKDEFLNGMAEVLKYAITLDAELFLYLSNHALNDFFDNSHVLKSLVKRCYFIKSKVVQVDPLDKKDRKKLNFGHTVGHAIEKAEKIKHGFAVAKGMRLEAAFARAFDLIQHEDVDRIEKLLEKYDLNLPISQSLNELWGYIAQDKKRNAEQIDLILLTNIGQSIIKPVELTDFKTLVKNTLNELQNNTCVY
jgi:3-dehydroquinate synthase